MTLEDVLAAALQYEEVARRLSDALRSDLVVAGPYKRRLLRHVTDHLEEYGRLPGKGDLAAWIETLEEREQGGVSEVLQDLWSRDISGYEPAHIANHAAAELEEAAAQNALSRLNRQEQNHALALSEAAEEVERIRTTAEVAERDWGVPEELGPPPPDPLPLDTLPEWVREHVDSVADHVQVPTDLPFLLALSALSTAAANKARIEIRPGHREPVHLWTATVLPPGARKSPVFSHMVDPLYEFEQQRVEEVEPERDRAEDRRDVIEGLLKDAKKSAQDAAEEGGVDQAFDRMEELREALEDVEVPTVPRLIVSDVTSEKLAQLMEENGGRIAVLSPEGDIFKILAGRYRSGQVTFDHYKRAWTGDEPIRDDRVGRDGSHVRRPALTMGLTLQPVVLEALQNKESFRGEGLLGRFVYALPEDRIGKRLTGAEVPEIDGAARSRYHRHLTRMLHEGPAGVDQQGEYEPHELDLTPEARETFFAFEAEVESELDTGGSLSRIPDWGAKLTGQVARIAGLLTLAARAGDSEPLYAEPVPERWMKSAVRIGRGLVPHARRALLHMVEVDPDLRLARYLRDRLREIGAEERITVRGLHQRVRGKKGLAKKDTLERILGRLEHSGHVRLVERPSTGGRPPSPWVLINPRLAARSDE